MRTTIFILFALLFFSFGYGADFEYPLVPAPSKPVNFSQKEIERIPYLNEQFFGAGGIAADREGNFYLPDIDRRALVDIRAFLRKRDELKIGRLKTKKTIKDLEQLARLANRWGLYEFGDALCELLGHFWEGNIENISQSQRLKNMTIADCKTINHNTNFIPYVVVNTLTGRTIIIAKVATVNGLKKQIFFKEGIDLESQRLLFLGKSLEDDHSLHEYGIQAGSTILIIFKISGR